MKKLAPGIIVALIFAAAFIAIQAFAYKPLAVSDNTVSIGEFTALHLEGPFDIYFTQGPVADARIESDADYSDKIQFLKSDNTLVIKTKDDKNWNWRGRTCKIYLTTPALDEVEINGSGDFYSTNQINIGKTLDLSIAGSGDINAEVQTPKVKANIAGSGDMDLKGNAEKIELSIAGTGDFSSAALIANEAKVDIAGTGDATIFAHDLVDASVSGTGDVLYLGNPQHVSASVSGTGSVEPKK